MANDVMSKFNMKGKKGKFAFRKLRIHQVIIGMLMYGKQYKYIFNIVLLDGSC